MSRLFRLLSCLTLLWPLSAAADETVITPADAAARARDAGLTIVDVRTPGEWRQTGVPQGAVLADINGPGGADAFLAAVTAAVGGDRSRPVAVICRSGNRSTAAQKLLLANGFATVLNIREGMAGNSQGPGWTGRGLPVQPCGPCS
jgi:rhodanese-related sulfurtransferase